MIQSKSKGKYKTYQNKSLTSCTNCFLLLRYQRQPVLLSDGGTVSLDWATTATTDPKTPIKLILHGLSGSSQSRYVLQMVKTCIEKGWRPVLMNARGCDGTPLTTLEGFNGVRTLDLEESLVVIRTQFPQAPIYGIAYSLGASLMIRCFSCGSFAGHLDRDLITRLFPIGILVRSAMIPY